MRILIFLLLFYGIQGTRIDYDKIKADNQDVSCNFNNYNQHAQDAFPKISAPHSRGCGGEMLRNIKIKMGKCSRCGCSGFCWNPVSAYRKLRCTRDHVHDDHSCYVTHTEALRNCTCGHHYNYH